LELQNNGFPAGSLEGYLNFKVYREFAAENRLNDWNAWLTLELSPPAPAAWHPPGKIRRCEIVQPPSAIATPTMAAPKATIASAVVHGGSPLR